MPFVGGFQFIKMTRDSEKTSKIPIIVYSVLSENNAKFYIKEQRLEYFLKKSESMEEIVSLAEKLIREHPLSEKYKQEILNSKISIPNLSNEIKIPQKMEEENEEINETELIKKIKQKYNSNFSDEAVFANFFSILYPVLKYELCVIIPQNSFEKEKYAFFDIRDIILSPIFQNKITEKFKADDVILYKKYAPNLKTVTDENEFLSKIEFNFEYRQKPLANVIIYSKASSKWKNEENTGKIKNAIFEFLKTHYLNKYNSISKKDSLKERYTNNNINGFKEELYNKNETFFTGIISLVNYFDITAVMTKEDIDILNSKISEKIISCIEENEQIIKNDDDEFAIIIYAKEYQNVLDRFTFIINTLEQIKYNNFSLEAFAGISECSQDNDYNIFEAQKNAYEALEKTSSQEKVIIYGT